MELEVISYTDRGYMYFEGTWFHIDTCKKMKKAEFIRTFKGLKCTLPEAFRRIKAIK